MMVARRPLYIANWKMNKTEFEARAYVEELRSLLAGAPPAEIAIAPPFTSLRTVGDLLAGSGINLAAQSIHWEPAGAYTGEISALMLADLSVTYVLVGHSERRTHFGETDERVARKFKAATVANLIPVLCVGENEQEREAGRTEQVIEAQLRRGLGDVGLPSGRSAIVAYEPVWAIGTGLTATPDQVDEAHRFLRGIVAGLAGDLVADEVRILYGGSVTPATVGPIAALPEIDGCLVGNASLSAASFMNLIRSGVEASGPKLGVSRPDL